MKTVILCAIALTTLLGCCVCQGDISQMFPSCSQETNQNFQNTVMQCAMPIVTYGTQKVGEIIKGPKRETLITLCSHLETVAQCVYKSINDISCIPDEYKTTISKGFESAKMGLDYVCANDAEVANDFFKKNGVRCMMTVGTKMGNCTTDYFKDRTDLLPQVLDKESNKEKILCSIVDPLKTCLVTPVEQQPNVCDGGIADLLSGTFDAMLKPYNCDGSSESDQNDPQQTNDNKKLKEQESTNPNGNNKVTAAIAMLIVPLIVPLV